MIQYTDSSDLAWSLEQSRRCKLLLVAVFFPDAYRALKDFEDRPGFETLERFEAELEKIKALRGRVRHDIGQGHT